MKTRPENPSDDRVEQDSSSDMKVTMLDEKDTSVCNIPASTTCRTAAHSGSDASEGESECDFSKQPIVSDCEKNSDKVALVKCVQDVACPARIKDHEQSSNRTDSTDEIRETCASKSHLKTHADLSFLDSIF